MSKDSKQKFLLMLGDKFTKTSVTLNHTSGDADLLIVLTVLKAEKVYSTVFIGEDAKLLILALHHFTNEKVFDFKNEPEKNQQSAKVWNVGKILGKICHGIQVIHNL